MSHLLSFSALSMVLLIPQVSGAQQNRWTNLEQIQPGQKLIVIDHQMKSLSGTFVRVSENSLVVKVDKLETAIDRDSVYRVTTGPQHRGRNALIGLGIGAATGGILAGTVPGSEELSAGDVVGVVAGMAGAGAGIGALIAPARTIYRADSIKKVASNDSRDQTQLPAAQ